MSQVVKGVTSSSKRPYRKGNPVSAAERQQKAVARKSDAQRGESICAGQA